MKRAIILAAGLGTRLRPLTDTIPKALVPLGGKPLLERSLARLAAASVDEVIIVVGYRHDVLERAVASWSPPFPVRFIVNERYAETNSIASLWLTTEHWSDGFILLDADIYFDQDILESLIDARTDAMIIDEGRPFEEIDMRVSLKGGRVWHLDKEIAREDTHGEFFGMSAFTAEGARALRAEVEAFIARGDERVWYDFALREMAKRYPIQAIAVGQGAWWCEIDSQGDLDRAEACFRKLGRG